MKVYVVTRGEYSNYSIDKVFLDKEKAEKYAELYEKTNRYADNVNVEEYIVYDEFFDSKLTEPIEFYVQYIDLESGKLGWDGKEKVLSSATSFYEFEYGDMLKACSQKSAEHAKKIAIEQYQIHTQRIYEEQMSYEEYFGKYLANMKGAING
jgi:hypothetical protein